MVDSPTAPPGNSSPSGNDHIFKGVFGGPPKYASSGPHAPLPAFDYDDVYKDQKASKAASMPVFDKPVYDEDIFEAISGLRSASVSASFKHCDVFSSISTSLQKHEKHDSSPFDGLLGNFWKKDGEVKKTERVSEEKKDTPDFDDLISGLGRSSSPLTHRSMPESNQSQKSSCDTAKTASNAIEDPFVVLESNSSSTVSSSGVFTDPFENYNKLSSSWSRKADQSSVTCRAFDDLDSLGKSVPEINKREDNSYSRNASMNDSQSPAKNSESHWQNRAPVDEFTVPHQSPFDMTSVCVSRSDSPPYMNTSPNAANTKVNTTSWSCQNFDSSDDVWLTVSEIPLFTQPTSAPPPSRPPPLRPTQLKRSESGSVSYTNVSNMVNEYSYSPISAHASARVSVTLTVDDLEDFATGRTRGTTANKHPEDFSVDDFETNSVAAAAAMKEAMEKAEAKFKYAREMREREYLKSARSKEGAQPEKDECREKLERLDRERKQRERENKDEELRRLEKEGERARELERLKEEKEREQKRLEKEHMQRERELARQAVERATKEARERAAAEAHAKAQKAAVEKAAAEARERAERAAVQRAHAEARERAAAEARVKAQKATAEARERANAKAREKETRERTRAERATAERVAAEARKRAAAEARERAATQARASHQRNDIDLDSFFSMGSRPSSVPRPRANSSNQRGPPEATGTSGGVSYTMRKASSTANIVDDLSSIFGAAAAPYGEFQEVEGESEERRRARLERHQRTEERAAKALAEKNERDLQAQREQAERHRIAETLDVGIKRWATGKEGNLRALLSTLQYVLWPDCGWQPVSLSDLITAASVKKVYRKATLCIHPDKVQQKGANLQQKYIAEKVFDLLKETWNKFNSEELF